MKKKSTAKRKMKISLLSQEKKTKDLQSSDVRQQLLKELRDEVIGPRWGQDEIIDKSPNSLYLDGMLFPQGVKIEAEEKENTKTVTVGNEDTQSENITNNFVEKTSSFGLSCSIKKDATNVKIKVSFGTYKTQGEKGSKQYKREHHEEEHTINLEKNESIKMKDLPWLELRYSIKNSKDYKMLSVYLVNTERSGKRILTKKVVFQPTIELSSDKRIFEHKITSSDSEEPLFQLLFLNKMNFGVGHGCAIDWDDKDVVDNSINKIWTDFIPTFTQKKITHAEPFNDELKKSLSMQLLYKVEDSKFSDYEVLLSSIPDEYEKWVNENLINKLNDLKNIADPELMETAQQQIKECQEALSRIRNGIKLISTNDNVGKAFKFANRVMALQQSHGEWAKKNIENEKIIGSPPKEEEIIGQWRLFQLAFILMNIESIVEPTVESRKIADLLWFPTGGGKTEAYLGLIAFTMAMRRLTAPRYENGMLSEQAYGVTTIMRYTLRLLTIQQFQRATALMCACEYERRRDKNGMWGDLPFNVGLWVGLKTTPNLLTGKDNYDSAESTLSHWRRTGRRPKEHNPVQLLNCPWCGEKLDHKDYDWQADKEHRNWLPEKCRAYCPNSRCFFSKKHLVPPTKTEPGKDSCLPILVVDEDIYKWCPSLLISTIDKFAQISWNEKTSAIFGKVDKYCQKCGFFKAEFDEGHKGEHKGEWNHWAIQESILPPELIVQDELHLIAGPLGTMAALYETAIDYFCKNNERYPKIIASTATTKAASEQIKNLFNREKTKIFPPQGITFGETFFSKTDEDDPGKIYVGICSTAKSGLTVLGRTSAALVRKVRYLKEEQPTEYPDKILDPYYTLVAYFNSMRELGGAASSYKDAVPDFIQQIYERVERRTTQENTQANNEIQKQIESQTDDTGLDIMLEEEKDTEAVRQEIMQKEERVWKNKSLETDELTSRQDSGSIPEVLRRLEMGLGSKTKVLDLLLSTNMLSVGVDIQRLGLMMINGQPKNHSEYIQASGRIGRRDPGLIITLFQYLKPRDLSHYENFKFYHSTFFKNVEPISLTPFSARARDHGLFGLLVGLIRNVVPILAKNADAGNFKIHIKQIRDEVEKIKKEFESRVDIVDTAETQNTINHIDRLLKLWEQYATQPIPLIYKSSLWTKKAEKQTKNYLLKTIEQGQSGLAKIPATPLSLREAEQQHKFYYLGDQDVPEE